MHYIKIAQEVISGHLNNLESLKSTIETNKEALKGLFGTGFGFSFFRLSSHAKSSISFYHKVPKVKIKSMFILPNLKVRLGSYIIHVHHWIWSLVLLAILIVITDNRWNWIILKGILTGTAIQGLTYKDRFKILFKTQETLVSNSPPLSK